MFLFIPAIVIVLLLAYLYLNDVSTAGSIVIYIFIVLVIVIPVYLYKNIQDDMKLQEINKISAEISTLKKKLSLCEDEKEKASLELKIKHLHEEISSKLK